MGAMQVDDKEYAALLKDAARYRLIDSIIVDMGHCYEIPLEPGATFAETIDAACHHAESRSLRRTS